MGGATPSGGLNLNINWKEHRWAVFYCLVATIGALCYGYDVSPSQMLIGTALTTLF